ncbi:MAG: hypothetical protein LBQ52_04525 [Helicobacteraceae bacterium]|nr:hypothetical protein [Helicobacteraceae bacterium]
MKSILFNEKMLRAVISGKKTQTRRVSHIQPPDGRENWTYGLNIGVRGKNDGKINYLIVENKIMVKESDDRYFSPKYKEGETIYIKEPYAITETARLLIYQHEIDPCERDFYKWKSPLFMPESFARIFLKIKNVRLERLQKMKIPPFLFDCLKEGFNSQAMFIETWDEISKTGYKWRDNPFVFVYDFERVERPK